MSVAFTQQGTVDWTSLGRMQFSASIAVLSRLSSAGIESLTVAFGQAMCTRIPLGAHGEKFLMDSLNKLKAFSGFGDLIWFGVGVRHVLRDLVQTSEGASLVALCASLAETYPPHVAALVVYEMAKQLKAPSELSPSLAQWEEVVKTCSCAFKETTFSLRYEKLLRLAGLSSSCLSRDISDGFSSGHAQDIARSIMVLGDIMRGTAEQITIHGGRGACWLATYAGLILGLRVDILMNGKSRIANFDEGKTKAQLCVHVFDTVVMENDLQHIGSTFTVRHGRDFIQQVFGTFGDGTMEAGKPPFLAGTVSWDTVITDTFGGHGRDLLSQLSSNKKIDIQGDIIDHLVQVAPFRVLYEASIVKLITMLGDNNDYDTVNDYMAAVVDRLPELRDFTASGSQVRSADIRDTERSFWAASSALRRRCGCSRCKANGTSDSLTMCAVYVAYTIVFLTHLVERCQLHSDLQPKRFGVYSLYMIMREQYDKPGTRKLRMGEIDMFRALFELGIEGLFTSYVALFTGTRPSHNSDPISRPQLSNKGSAFSAGGIYCFLDSLKGLSMNFSRASKVHVGCGVIEYRSRLHTWVLDPSHTAVMSATYPPDAVTQTNNLEELWKDLSSWPLTLEAVVEDTFRLVFYYRISSPTAKRLIFPAAFVHESLGAISRNMARAIWWTDTKYRGANIPSDMTYGLVRGEGHVHASETGILLRPHMDNLLAQCLVATSHERQTVFVTNKLQLASILEWYAMQLDEGKEGAGPPRLFIISG
ncbi:hypothetical protein BJX68DRAFT_263276 [Aspergillus pseudodeflectus]|uniref:Uncharacterized protein n=1 Tax=Aspergillus pseudodeflectus TaxID=176178 RepID=A0ABR4KWS8_9EURO